MKALLRVSLGALLVLGLAYGQQWTRYSATTGDMSLTGASTATIQQPATNGSDVILDQIVVYCSVACSVTQAANGTAATTTAGTVTPILPAPANTPATVKFFTASNVGSGTAQGGITHIPAGGTAVLCLSKSCGAGADVTLGYGGGGTSNYSVTIASISGTANITFLIRSFQ
jgi:hypothetical protein